MRELLTVRRHDLVLHTRRMIVPWAGELHAAADRLRSFGHLLALRSQHPAVEVIAVGRLTATGDSTVDSMPRVNGTDRVDGTAHGRLAGLHEALSALTIHDENDELDRAAFGFLTYQQARGLVAADDGSRQPPTPEHGFFLPRVLVRREGETLLVAARDPSPEGARLLLSHVADALARPASARGPSPVASAPLYTVDRHGFRTAIRAAQRAIADGDVFQLVLSMGCKVPVSHTDALRLYRRLAAANPSPLHFLYASGTFGAVGASARPYLTVEAGQCRLRPMAGTQLCEGDRTADQHNAARMVSSEPELAKHRMVVDLVRADLGRICVPGSIHANELLTIEHYSNAMHIASECIGTLAAGMHPVDAVRACMPAGTVTGAPRLEAMRLIDALEPGPRGLYGGVVGLVSPTTAMLYLTSQTAMLVPGRVHLHAGTGIVLDSDPHLQYDRCRMKLRPLAAALEVTI